MSNVMEPLNGNVVGADGKVTNLVDALNGGTPIPGIERDPNRTNPRSGTIIGSNGQVYDLADLLSSAGQAKEMPDASDGYAGRIIMYTGNTTADFIHAHFYECVQSGDTYGWAELSFGAGGGMNASVVGKALVIS